MRTLTRTTLKVLAAGLLLAPALAAAPGDSDELREKFEKKLALEFVEHGGWITDYDKALEKAKEEGKVLFVYFSRSYAP